MITETQAEHFARNISHGENCSSKKFKFVPNYIRT